MCAWAGIETQESTCQVGGKNKTTLEEVEGRQFIQVPSATNNAVSIKMN